jgi:hypothetical protein
MEKSRAFKKGSDFETTTYLILKRQLRDALIVHDVHVPYKPNPAQIDILVVRGWSFHVLELKNYEYSLTGHLEDKKWTAKSGAGSYYVQNPILQNSAQSFKLIQAMKSLKFPPPREIKGFVIVPDTCRLNIDSHLKQTVITAEAFVQNALKSKPGTGDLQKLREVLLSWKK